MQSHTICWFGGTDNVKKKGNIDSRFFPSVVQDWQKARSYSLLSLGQFVMELPFTKVKKARLALCTLTAFLLFYSPWSRVAYP